MVGGGVAIGFLLLVIVVEVLVEGGTEGDLGNVIGEGVIGTTWAESDDETSAIGGEGFWIIGPGISPGTDPV